MKKIRLPKIARSYPIAFWSAFILHLLLLFGLIFSNIQRWEIEQKTPSKINPKPIPKAIIVDLQEIVQEKQRIADIQKQKQLKIKREEKRLRVLEDERYQKQRKINQLKVKAEQEKKSEALAEQRRKLAEKKAKEAEEKKKLAEDEKKLAEKNAREADKQKQAIEKQRQTAANQFKKEQNKRALTKEVQTEQDQERAIAQEDILNELKANYINQIAARVKNQWRYQGAKDNWGCDVYILQDVDGKVISVNLQSCHVDNSSRAKSFKDSIERAVYKASPLPAAPDESVFDGEVLFLFRAN